MFYILLIVKRTTSLEYNLKRPTINLSDLKRVVETLKESGVKEAPNFSIVFHDDRKTKENYDSIEEIIPTRRRVESLSMRVNVDDTSYTSLTLSLTSYTHSLQIWESSQKSRGVFENVKDTLKICENKPRWLLSKLEYLYILLPLLFWFAAQYMNNPNNKKRLHLASLLAEVALLIIALGLIRLYVYGILRLGRGFRVRLQDADNAKGFIGKNRDELIVQTMGAVVAGVILVGIGYLLGRQ